MANSWTRRTVILTLLLTLAGPTIKPVQAHDFFRAPTEEEKTDFKAWIASVGEKDEAKNVDPALLKPGSFFLSTATSKAASTTLYVDQAGHGQFSKVQDAVDSIPSDSSRTERIVIKVAPGTYHEQVIIGKDKPYITLLGSGQWTTKISWREDLGQSGSDFTDAAAQISGNYFTAIDISFENTSPAPPSGAEKKQATALAISGDAGAFLRTGFFGFQDTLYDKQGRHYFQDVYVEGSIDFIYGDGQSFYTNADLNVVPVQTGSLTAQKRMTRSEPSGFSFVGCKVTGDGLVYLGRAWGPASRTVYSYTYLADIINPVGWYNWGVDSRDKTVFYGEYKNYGPGASTNGRVGFGQELSDSEARPFLTVNFINGHSWLPDSGIST